MLKKLLSLTCGLLLAGLVSADEVSGPAPGFALAAKAGGEVSLEGLKGQVVMVNFWASWCGPCRQEMPHLEALHQRYESLGFTLLGVNVDKDSGDAEGFLEDTPVTFPILFDPESSVSELYDVIAMPTTVLVDRSGNMRFIHHGYKPGYENDYQAQIRALIRE